MYIEFLIILNAIDFNKLHGRPNFLKISKLLEVIVPRAPKSKPTTSTLSTLYAYWKNDAVGS